MFSAASRAILTLAAATCLLSTACANPEASQQEQDATALGCWVGTAPLDECFPHRYASFDVHGEVWRMEDGQHLALPGVTVRFVNQTYESVVLSEVSNGKGDTYFEMPGIRYGARGYTLQVLEGDEIRFSGPIKSGFYFFSVVFEEDGTVSACKWIDDDACAELASEI